MIELYIEKIENIGYINLLTKNNKFIRISFNNGVLYTNYNILKKPNSLMLNFLENFFKYLQGVEVDFDFPFILDTTEFKLKVYNALKQVKYGKLVTYKDLACQVGNCKAFRAVGMACKKNPLPLIIPCHRVIKSNGDLGGFSGGVHIKKSFINIENKGVKYGI